jgi:hypothetical protein
VANKKKRSGPSGPTTGTAQIPIEIPATTVTPAKSPATKRSKTAYNPYAPKTITQDEEREEFGTPVNAMDLEGDGQTEVKIELIEPTDPTEPAASYNRTHTIVRMNCRVVEPTMIRDGSRAKRGELQPTNGTIG